MIIGHTVGGFTPPRLRFPLLLDTMTPFCHRKAFAVLSKHPCANITDSPQPTRLYTVNPMEFNVMLSVTAGVLTGLGPTSAPRPDVPLCVSGAHGGLCVRSVLMYHTALAFIVRSHWLLHG